MFEKLGEPLFVREAREAVLGRRFTAPAALLAVLLVFLIATWVEGVFLVPFLLSAVMNDKLFWELLSSGDSAGMVSYTERLMQENPLLTVGTLFASAALALGAIVFCRGIEKRGFSTMGFYKRTAGRGVLYGAAFGALLPILAFLFTLVFGGISFGNGAGRGSVGLFLALLLGMLAQATFEEIFFRGYVMVSLSKQFPLSRAMILGSLIFAFFQRANGGFTPIVFVNAALLGLLCALLMIRTGSIFAGITANFLFHAFFVLGLGSSLRGMSAPACLFSVVFPAEKAFLHGGVFGLSGGIAATFALSLGIAVLGMMKTKE